MAVESHPEHISTYSKGANTDSEPELIFSQPGSGYYIDSRNAQPSSNDKQTGSMEKIRGEEILYPNASNSVGYSCIASRSVNGNVIEFWAPVNTNFPGIVRVNGVVVLSSVKFEMRVDYPLQTDINPSALYTEIAFTDRRVPPYILNITDMVDSLVTAPNKYFNNFDPLLYQVNLQSPLDIPVFIELVNVGGGGGLPVGQYAYKIRYVSIAGDATNWSQATPMIPVMENLSSDSIQYPYAKTYGGPPAPSSPTAFAPRIRFRVTNLYNYDYIEVQRIPNNAGAGIEYTPNGIVVAKIDINPGEISVRDFIDPSQQNTTLVLSNEDETQQVAEIEWAGSIRYFDKRLVLADIKLASKEDAVTFKKINGKEGFPIIDKLFKAGYKDPWNHTYKQKYMGGEKYSFASVCIDGVGTPGFATKIDSLFNYQFPNRRDVTATETNNYSYHGSPRAATTQVHGVGSTHEVFDLADATRKTNLCDFKNIIEHGRVTGATGTKSTSLTNEECSETHPEIENHGANVTTGGTVSVAYQPYRPVKQNDTDVSGHNYIPTVRITQSGSTTGPDVKSYRPLGFAPDYYAMGMMVAGVQNFPSWAKAFSIVRTQSANRVVCQGLAYYKLIKGKFQFITDAAMGGKEQNKFNFYSPDIDHGIVSSNTVNDIIDNPQNYKLQFVSPLGFFSEWYNARDKFSVTDPSRDSNIDMISYVRLLRDLETDANQQVNPFEDANMGINGGDGWNYIRHDKYRNTTNDPLIFGPDPDGGNRIITLNGATRVAQGRGNFIELDVAETIYAEAYTGGSSNAHFQDARMKNWTEPIYIVNIIRVGAEVKDNNIQEYKQTTHYQKLESIIGKSTGVNNQQFILVDERWEDVIPAMNYGQYGTQTDRFIYIKHTDGTVEKWISIAYKTSAQITTIIANINSNATPDIKGVYTHTNVNDRLFTIVFNNPNFIPPVDSLIMIRYDDTAPIRIFGGDTFVGETIFSPIDNESSSRDKSADTSFAFGIGLPYRDFRLNPRYYAIRKAGALINVVQDADWFSLGYIRQLCVMFTVESKAAVHLTYNSSYPNEAFPLTNYVIRPNLWDIDKSLVDNNIYPQYEVDYPSDEKTQWKWGGFRFLQQINPDYSVQHKTGFFSKPKVGFVEKLEFPTRMMWSLPRAINVQDAPGLKTFAANSHFDLDDDQGGIHYIYDATTGSGENLYAVTETGVCMLVTNKSILTDLNAGAIGYMDSDTFIKNQLWISKEIGSADKMWRGISEAMVSLKQADGSEAKAEALFFPSRQSVYRLMNNQLIDIGRQNYYTKVYGEGVSKILPGLQTHVTSIFNIYTQQYWLYIRGEGVDELYVFGQRNDAWVGTNDFKYDRFTVMNNRIFGHRDMQTFELNKGYIINGEPVVYELIDCASPSPIADKEFIRLRLNGTDTEKPTRVEFYKELNGPLQCALDPSILSQGVLFMKNYRGFEGYVPRLDTAVSPDRFRFQQRLIITKIIHNLASEFKVADSTMQFKLLK